MPDLAQPWIQTPAFLQDRARKVHSALHGVNDSVSKLVATGRVTTDHPKYKQWKQLLADWGKWYGDTSGSTWLWNSADATLEGYERAIQTWVDYWAKMFPESAQNLPTPPTTYKPPELPSLPDVGGAALGLAVGAAVALGAILLLSRR